MRFCCFILFLVLIFALSSCETPLDIEDNVIKKPIDPAFILPLKVDNRWIYSEEVFDSHGLKEADSFDTITITGEIVIDNNNWFIENRTANRMHKHYIRNSAFGLERWPVETFDTAFPDRKFPSAIGDNYVVPFSYDEIIDSLRTTRKVLSSDEIVDVPAGRFRCLKYSDTVSGESGETLYDPYRIDFFSPGFGLIKSILYRISPTGQVFVFRKKLLKEFTIAE